MLQFISFCCLCESIAFHLIPLFPDFLFYDFLLMSHHFSQPEHLFSAFSLHYSHYCLCPLLLFSLFIFCPVLTYFTPTYCFYFIGSGLLLSYLQQQSFYSTETKGVSWTLIVQASRAKRYGFSLVFIDVITAVCSRFHYGRIGGHPSQYSLGTLNITVATDTSTPGSA